MVNITVCLFRRNLRLADNLALARALRHHTGNPAPSVFVPLYCLDVKKEWNRQWFGIKAWGMRRRCFLVESLGDLDASIDRLYVSKDGAPTALHRLLGGMSGSSASVALFAPEEIGHYELREQRAIERLCKEHQVKCDFSWDVTSVSAESVLRKYAPNSSTVPPASAPLNGGQRGNEAAFLSGNQGALAAFRKGFPGGYSSFRRTIEAGMGDAVTASSYLDTSAPPVAALIPPPTVPRDAVPDACAAALREAGFGASLSDVVVELQADGELPGEEEFSPSTGVAYNQWVGGERAGQARVQKFVWDTDAVATYKATRNRSIGDVFSSKFSMWLAHGCITGKQIVHEIARYERDRIGVPAPSGGDVQLQSTYWVVFELMWRDFCTLAEVQVGRRLFDYGGIRKAQGKWARDGAYPVLNNRADFAAWCEGRTGFPLVDAAMRELVATGFMSNRCRQNVASFLVYNLGVDWRWGGAFFEHHLLDHQVGANYVNWQTVSGVGWQQRDNVFNVVKQSVTYEPDAMYYRTWIQPDGTRGDFDLTRCPDHFIHVPWECKAHGFDGAAWREKMVRPPSMFFYNRHGLQDDIRKAKAAQGVDLDVGNNSTWKAKRYYGRGASAEEQAAYGGRGGGYSGRGGRGGGKKRKNRLQQ